MSVTFVFLIFEYQKTVSDKTQIRSIQMIRSFSMKSHPGHITDFLYILFALDRNAVDRGARVCFTALPRQLSPTAPAATATSLGLLLRAPLH